MASGRNARAAGDLLARLTRTTRGADRALERGARHDRHSDPERDAAGTGHERRTEPRGLAALHLPAPAQPPHRVRRRDRPPWTPRADASAAALRLWAEHRVDGAAGQPLPRHRP